MLIRDCHPRFDDGGGEGRGGSCAYPRLPLPTHLPTPMRRTQRRGAGAAPPHEDVHALALQPGLLRCARSTRGVGGRVGFFNCNSSLPYPMQSLSWHIVVTPPPPRPPSSNMQWASRTSRPRLRSRASRAPCSRRGAARCDDFIAQARLTIWGEGRGRSLLHCPLCTPHTHTPPPHPMLQYKRGSLPLLPGAGRGAEPRSRCALGVGESGRWGVLRQGHHLTPPTPSLSLILARRS